MSFQQFWDDNKEDFEEFTENRIDIWDLNSLMRSAYEQAITDFEELLDNAKSNGGGIDLGNGRFIEGTHWDFELRDQLTYLKES